MHEALGAADSPLACLLRESCAAHAAAELRDLTCIVSDDGAPRQPLHPDAHWATLCPFWSIFVALSDVDDALGTLCASRSSQHAVCHKHILYLYLFSLHSNFD